MPDYKNGGVEFDINEFAEFYFERCGIKLTLNNAKFVEGIIRGEPMVLYTRASGKLELKRLLNEYLEEALDAV